jgi:hypothetical protein
LIALDETIPVLEKLQIWADETLKSVAPNFNPIKKLLSNLKENTNQYATKCENLDNNVQQDKQTVTNGFFNSRNSYPRYPIYDRVSFTPTATKSTSCYCKSL